MVDINNLSKEQKELMIDIQKMKDSTDRTKPIESENFRVTVSGQYQELFNIYDKQNEKNALMINFWFQSVNANRTTDPKLIEAAEFAMNNKVVLEKSSNTLDDKIKEAKAMKENRQAKAENAKNKETERD